MCDKCFIYIPAGTLEPEAVILLSGYSYAWPLENFVEFINELLQENGFNAEYIKNYAIDEIAKTKTNNWDDAEECEITKKDITNYCKGSK